MKLVHPMIENQIIFEAGYINVLVIENHKQYSDLIQELYKQINGGEGEYVLSIDAKPLDVSKSVEILVDLFSLEINNKKIVTKLYNHIRNCVVVDDFLFTSELLSSIQQYMIKLEEYTQFPLKYDTDVDVTAIFKALNLKLNVEEGTFLEKLIDYISALQEFSDIKCLVLVNLKSYLNEDEQILLYNQLSYNKINVLLLEPCMSEIKLKNENIYLIDYDLCEIL